MAQLPEFLHKFNIFKDPEYDFQITNHSLKYITRLVCLAWYINILKIAIIWHLLIPNNLLCVCVCVSHYL